MGQEVLQRLESLRVRNKNNLDAVNDGLYRLVCRKETLTLAYNLIRSKPGNMTPGIDNETLDEMSEAVIERLIKDLQNLTFKFKPVRRVYIPKANSNKERPLGVPSPMDKVVQKAMLLILESIYDPTFSVHSHGFRPGLSPHSALREIRSTWSGIKWIIEGDIEGCYDNVDHHSLINILRRKIKDEKFIQLIWKLLRAGVEIDGVIEKTKKGTPQGGILSPLLANIYLHELDQYLENMSTKIDAESTSSRRENPEYKKISGKMYRLRTKRTKDGTQRIVPTMDAKSKLSKLSKEQRKIPSKDPLDEKFKKLIFVRYADDWIIGIIGSKEQTKEILTEVKNFLEVSLKLKLSKDKTKITLAASRKAMFLGFQLQASRKAQYSNLGKQKKRTVGWQPRLFVPIDRVITRLSEKNFCTKNGIGIRKKGWILYPDDIIVNRYNYIIRGLRNYYAPADNFGDSMNRIEYILKYSCAHTLACKHNSRVSVQTARLSKLGLSLSKSHKNNIWDFKTKPFEYEKIFKTYSRKTRYLTSDRCTICQSTENLEMHHIKALRKDGVDLADKYAIALMQRMNRKQITVCRRCHMDIHRGRYDGNSLSILDL
jgi:group II intron reverse transcriptase/maturase